MSISFTCPKCARPYRVDDKYAGKRVPCKHCGAMMSVPEAAPAPGLDVYGLDEPSGGPGPSGPLPPRGAPPAGETGPAPGELPRKKKKKRGRASSGDGPSGLKKGIRVAIGLVSGVVAYLVVSGLPTLFGIGSGSELERHHETILAANEEIADALETIVDPATLAPATTRVRGCVHRMVEVLKSMDKKKYRKTDIARIERKFVPRTRAVLGRIRSARARLEEIPGAIPALEGCYAEMEAFAATHPELRNPL